MSTPIDFRISGVHGINRFLWAKLQEHLGWDKKNYQGMVPIITAQQEQDFNDSGYPYIVYNYRSNQNGMQHWIKDESIAYIIYGSNEADARQVLNLIEYYFSAFDESAEVLNDYINALPAGPSNDPLKDFDYKTISVPTITGAAPSDQEGGIMDASAAVFTRYTSSRVLRMN